MSRSRKKNPYAYVYIFRSSDLRSAKKAVKRAARRIYKTKLNKNWHHDDLICGPCCQHVCFRQRDRYGRRYAPLSRECDSRFERTYNGSKKGITWYISWYLRTLAK